MVKVIQTNFTAGVLDPLMVAREDIEDYYNGLAQAVNVVVQPVGGITARSGYKKIARNLRKLAGVNISGATLTAPQGGTPANIRDGNETTALTTSNNLGTTNPFVVIHIDLGTSASVCAIDIINYKLSTGTLDDEIRVQYSTDNTNWHDFATPFDWGATDRTRRLRMNSVSARYWRVARVGATNVAATCAISEIKFWSESSTLSGGRLSPFTYDTNSAYMIALTDQNADVYAGDQFVGAARLPHTSDQLAVINWTQSLDTMLLFHVEHQPHRLFHQGSGDEFDSRVQDFQNIPKVDYGAGVGGVNEVQELNDGGTVSTGGKFTVLLEGNRTTTITAGATRNDTAASIQAALRALDNTSATGITVTQNADAFIVTFGGSDGSQPWQEMSVSVLAGNSVWITSRTTEGEYPGEPIMSDARGWPRCGCFYQQRLHMGGVAGKPNALISSRVSDFFDLDITVDDATKALLLGQDGDPSTFFQIVPGRNLSIFSNFSENYIAKEPIDEGSVIKQSTKVGIREGIRVFDMDGALVFIQGDGASIREFLFLDTEQAYQASNLSYKAGALINAPVDADLRRAINADETDQLYIVNGDGTMALMAALRSQSIPGAFTQLTIANGKIKSVGVDINKNVYLLTERTINGQAVEFIERADRDYFLDCSGKIAVSGETYTATPTQSTFTWTFSSPGIEDEIGVRVNGARLNRTDFTVDLVTKQIVLDTPCVGGEVIRIAKMVKTVTGVQDFDGATLKTIVDGTPSEDVNVASGSFTLTDYADTSIEYGFDVPIYAELLPPRLPSQETLTGKKLRIPRVLISLYQTAGIEISVNGGPWREPSLDDLDSAVLDQPANDMLYTGIKDIRGIQGWGDGVVRLRRPRPGKWTVRSVTREVVV